ncbi:hypothetical protein MIND_00412900 [Mycena indigotica]|uniref:Uncharacterized protein n=1 Tax=Mycena indigotica TaxID=2126181 RepID=A0A8H6W576_9AGAR|nr:uncharacterized protein MIND_00412900 [Mycena indigotica]KAF7306224.1 hypothetical protein MIND_00412900 [Mycena indigotica]
MEAYSHVGPGHSLHRDDRMRLMRSTRKIGEVMGETPHPVYPAQARKPDKKALPPVPPPKDTALRHRHRPSLDYTREVTSNGAASASIARPVLFINLPESPQRAIPRPLPTLSPTLTPTLTPTPLPSPSSTVKSFIANPHSIAGAIRRYGVTIKDESARRRTMAKLARTLGETVPPALVFPPDSETAKKEERKARRLTVRSVKSDKGSVRSVGRESVTSRTSRETRSRKRGGKDDISRGWVWVGRPEEIPVGVKVKLKPRRRVDSGAPPFNWYPPHEQEEDDIPEDDDEYLDEASALAPYMNDSLRVRRREDGWSGEWVGNVQNMDEVVKGLRSLKVR